MASTVDIEVRLDGAEEAKKGLKGIGETASSMADRFDKTNSHLGEGLGSLVGNVEDASGAFKDLQTTVTSLGSGGKASFLSLIPAIGGVVAVGFALYETFLNISGAAQKAEESQEAFAAAAGDLQSKLEALAEKGVTPTAKELESFTRKTLLAQVAKERAQIAAQKFTSTLEEEEKAQKHLTQTIIERKGAMQSLLVTIGLADSVSEARLKLEAKQAKTNREINSILKQQQKLQVEIKDAEQEYIAMEEQSPDFIATKVKENLERLKTLELQEVETEHTKQHYIDMNKLEIEREHLTLQSRLRTAQETAKIDQSELVRLAQEVKTRLSFRDAEAISARLIDKERRGLEKKRREEARKHQDSLNSLAKARLNKELADKKIADAKRLMLERQAQNELFSLRTLQIQQMKQAGATELQILESQHQLEQDRARENHALLLAADIRFEMAKTELLKSEEAKRQAERDKRQAEILKQIDERTQREQAYIDQAGEIADAFGGAFAEASFGALAMGESFKESIAQIIFGLGKQAAVESLISTAKGFSSLAMTDFIGAANNFKAAAGFAAGAVAAGAIGGHFAGGGGGGGGGSASPSGAPQIAPTPERESAQETSTVFNINFGGAVIYDTKQAAERAMVDRLVGVMNQRNRGARRLNLGRS
jgi:hypothetical protein